jgi:Na+/melibiose symporter-like transporter
MRSVSKANYGIASALLNTTRTSANLSGVALATTIVTITMGAMGFEPNLSAVTAVGGDGVRIAFVTGLSRAFVLAGTFVLLSSAISAVRRPQADKDDSGSLLLVVLNVQP